MKYSLSNLSISLSAAWLFTLHYVTQYNIHRIVDQIHKQANKCAILSV